MMMMVMMMMMMLLMMLLLLVMMMMSIPPSPDVWPNEIQQPAVTILFHIREYLFDGCSN